MESGLLPVDSEPSQTEEFMEKLKQTFDLTLVDSWSVAVPPKPRLFSPHVDGIVLVIDAGKTRWQIAEKQKRELAAQGGNVLGVILNNRTYPIPDSIYSRL
jgi:Mrp family chromosome partitioning ATPase